MGHRTKRASRCSRCRLHDSDCLCEHLPRLELRTRIAIVIHYRELRKTTSTGPLASAALRNSELWVHGLRDAPLDLNHLHNESRRVCLLFPSEGARPLSRSIYQNDPRPITLVVPDGSWRQATRIPRRVPGLERAERVTLPNGPPSRWGVRKETRPGGLATLEAIARALGSLESAAVQHSLERLFERAAEATLRARGIRQAHH